MGPRTQVEPRMGIHPSQESYGGHAPAHGKPGEANNPLETISEKTLTEGNRGNEGIGQTPCNPHR